MIRKKAILSPLILMLALVFIYSCKEDSSTEKVDLKGTWKMYKALRNNQPTSTLDNAYIEFVNDSVMKTNILGKDVESFYEYGPKGTSIRQYSEPLMEYQIRALSQDSMALATKIRNYAFQFFLARE